MSIKTRTPKSCTGVAGTYPVPSSVVPTWIYTGRYYRLPLAGTTGATFRHQFSITVWLPPLWRYRPGSTVGTTDSGIHRSVQPTGPPVQPVNRENSPTKGFQDVMIMGRPGGCNLGLCKCKIDSTLYLPELTPSYKNRKALLQN